MKNWLSYLIGAIVIALVFLCISIGQDRNDTINEEGIRKDWESKSPTTTYETGSYEVINGKIQLRNDKKTEGN